MRKSWVLVSLFISIAIGAAVGFGIAHLPKEKILELAPSPTPVPTPLSVYEIENLAKAEFKVKEFEIKEEIEKEETFTSYVFEHELVPDVSGNEIKKVSGQINIPNESGQYPLILMARGYVDKSIYETGVGTRPSAAYFAENGFITVAPDFLGYGDSSSEAENIYETRFQTYVTFISLLNVFTKEFADATKPTVKWDGENIFVWGHSNGGQIVLTSLAATGKEIPTTLWAPVTKPFPYSILYYTDDSEDGGKYIRRELSRFEELYDVDRFSFTKYLEKINAPIQIHQGEKDDAIPTSWSDQFVAKLQSLDKKVEYFTYPEADHNMRPDWDTVVERDLEFFNSFIEKE